MTADLCVTSGSHLYVHCSGARKKLLREPFMMDGVKTLRGSVFAGPVYVKHAGGECRGEKCI